MMYLQQVQIGINFIEANLERDFTLSDVATAAGLSQWHFQRIFKGVSSQTLKCYIRARRLAISLDKLSYSTDKIIDIAIAAGYESQESYTRAFKAAFGLTPNAYRKTGNKGMLSNKLELTSEYLQHVNHTNLQPQIIQRKGMLLAGLKTELYGADSDKNNMCAKLPSLWHKFLSRLKDIPSSHPHTYYGVVQQRGKHTDQLEYYAAIEVDDIASIPKEMESITIAPANYAVFTHTGRAKNIDNTVNYIYGNWLVQSNQQHTSAPDLEIYDHRYNDQSDDSVFEYAIPIEPIT